MIFIKCYKNSILLSGPNRTSERPSYLFSLYFFSFIALNQIIEHTEVKNQEMRRTLTVGSMIDDSIDFSTGRNWEQYFQIDAAYFLKFTFSRKATKN